ncbi:hypothetical protein HYU21_01925 [Candidatus Woesearchaeota archaeon]|nr:hypothetical protein [Candidatus Woesearchaeota archaeon]
MADINKENNEEKSQYVLNQSLMRAVLPKLFSLLILGLIFYGGVLLNLGLLSLSLELESLIKMVSIIILVVLVLFSLLLSWRQARAPYLFFSNKINFKNNYINYNQIILSSSKQNILDKLLKTYSLDLGNGFVLRHIKLEQQVSDYIKQMIQFNGRWVNNGKIKHERYTKTIIS